MKIVLATTNNGKLKELLSLSKNLSAIEFELAPDGFNVIESGKTFQENAQIKAIAAAELTGQIALADDSGLEVAALNGEPGIYSARYCKGIDADRRAKLLHEMKDIPQENRQARFVCAMVLANPKGEVLHSCISYWEGSIGLVEQGTNGFGYDALFYLPQKNLTAAELDQAEKNRISHRAQAFQKIQKFLANWQEQPKLR